MVLKGKQFEGFRRKKNTSSLDQKTPLNKRPQNTTIENGFCKPKKETKQKLEKKHSDQNCWNFARLELRSRVLTCSILCSL